MCERLGLVFGHGPHRQRMLAIGSVVHFARAGDVVWGSGVNGKIDSARYERVNVDVRAVRGPRTADFLRKRNVEVPAVYGDPGLLISEFFARDDLAAGHQRRAVTIIPNLNDVTSFDLCVLGVVLPTEPLMQCLGKIAASDLVVGSSLHAIVVAEAFGIPARLVVSENESRFKYEDYYLGSGRAGFTPADSAEDAIEMGGEVPVNWDAAAVMKAFPRDLFHEA